MKKLICYSIKEKNLTNDEVKTTISSIVVKTDALILKELKSEIILYLKNKDLEPENKNLILSTGFEVIDLDILAISDVDYTEEVELYFRKYPF